MKFLIDECLSAKLVGVCRERGHEATHVVWLGKQGWKDWNLIRHIVDDDYTFVTNNAQISVGSMEGSNCMRV
jgi:predicted nuclease of predicted toxin-antitoxin system